MSSHRNPDVPEPNCHGWVRTKVVSLNIDRMHGQAAPDAVLELLACQCKRECLQRTVPLFVSTMVLDAVKYMPATDMEIETRMAWSCVLLPGRNPDCSMFSITFMCIYCWSYAVENDALQPFITH